MKQKNLAELLDNENSNSSTRFWNSSWMGGILGLIFFVLFFGIKILDPTNINWLLSSGGDIAGQFVGWEVFRNEVWHFPIGLMENLGFPIKTAILYYDPVPALAIFFKAISALLPKEFQYYGIWIALCIFLQGFFAWSLASKSTVNPFYKIIATLFFLFSPIMLIRFQMGHEALGAHWLLLAAISLYVGTSSKKGLRHWYFLLLSASVINPYMLSMVAVIWVAFLVKEVCLNKAIAFRKAIVHALVSIISLLVIFWLMGFFIFNVSKLQSLNFGLSSLNLLAPINPSFPWVSFSKIIRPFPSANILQYEGFNYLGVGILFLSVPAFCNLFEKRLSWQDIKPWAPLLMGCLILMVHALSNRITFGGMILFTYKVPKFVSNIEETFRVSGRYFWPTYYLIFFWIFRSIFSFSNILLVRVLLIFALFLQIFDFSNYYPIAYDYYHKPLPWNNPLHSDIWQKIPQHYKNIVFVPTNLAFTPPMHDNFVPFAHYVSANSMRLNATNASRVSPAEVEAEAKKSWEALASGRPAEDSIYILGEHISSIVAAKLGATDGLGLIDGFNVLLPKWFTFKDCCNDRVKIFPPDKFRELFSVFPVGKVVSFANNGSNQYLILGWSVPETWGVWSDGLKAEIGVRVNASKPMQMKLKVQGYINSLHKSLVVHVTVNGKEQAIWNISENAIKDYKLLLVPDTSIEQQNYVIHFTFQEPKSPLELGLSDDQRKLGIGLYSAELTPEPQK